MISMIVVMLIVPTIIAVVGIYNMAKVGDDIRRIANSEIPLLNSITEITFMQLHQSVQLQRALIAAEQNNWVDFEHAESKFLSLENSAINQFAVTIELTASTLKNVASSEDKQRYETLKIQLGEILNQYKDFTDGSKELLSLLLSGQIASADVDLSIIEKRVEGMGSRLQTLTAQISGSTRAAAVVTNQQEGEAEGVMIVISVLAFGIVLLLGIWMLRSVNNQLGGDPSVLEEISESLANGDLKMDRDKSAVGVYGSINATVDRLIEIISGIKTGANEVHDASELVSMGNENLSQRTQEQASSLEEVASSMEQMTSVINQNAENAKLTNQLTIDAREEAENGVKVVGNAVSAVNEINESSNKIAEIIGVIDDIAFQTNLLALNAAVEAARAGEQGRGFAVVANEVRNLAGRSATAAKEIKVLIQDSVEKVENGAKLVNASGKSLEAIVAAVTKASSMVSEITEASKQQSEGITQVNKALADMDNMTQQNATLVEEAASASLFMGEQAQNLTDLVSYFNLGLNETVEVVAQQEAFPDQSTGDSQIEDQKKIDRSLQADPDWNY